MAARPYKLLSLACMALLLSACGATQAAREYPESRTTSLSVNDPTSRSLYHHFQEWKDVPYRYGGLSKNGIDCSGFVYITYLSRFGIQLPRSTELLSRIGTPIRRDDLKPGDLVFFITGRNVRHVGIYVENGKFIHASKTSGVTLSSLENPYWAQHYWKSVSI